jgi:hypothetical protein
MKLGQIVFSIFMSLLPDYEFNKYVARYNGDGHAFFYLLIHNFEVLIGLS